MEDLDKSIVHFTESILLVPLSCPEHGPMILQALFYLAKALVMRSKVSKQPGDAIYAAKYLSHLQDLPHEISDVPRHLVTTCIVEALATQVELEAGDVMQIIREMAVLCREPLTLDTSDVYTTRLILLIQEVISKLRVGVPDQPLDELIECLRAARKHKPDLLKVRLALANTLIYRYCMTNVNDDYEEAASILDEVITSNSPEDSQEEFIARAQGLATALALVRSDVHETPENLEEAIYRNLASHGSSVLKTLYPSVARIMEDIADGRVYYFGSIEGLEASSSNSPLSQLRPWMPEWGPTVDKVESLLLWIRNNEDTTKIDEAIQKGRTIVAAYSPTDPLKSHILGLYSDCLDEAFERTMKIEYINESISTRRQTLEYPFAHVPGRFNKIRWLSLSLLSRSMRFPDYRPQDLDEGMELCSQYVNDAHAKLPNRFRAACLWAYVARGIRHLSVFRAYETAVSLMEDTLPFSPTLQLQHRTLTTEDTTLTMPLDYASLQVDLGHVEEAVETLERGRALLWSEMRHLRTSIDQLLEADPVLGHKFAATNQELEELTKSVPPSHKLSVDDGAADNLRAVDGFSRLLLKQRGLLKQRDELILQIQALPGFDNFLTPPSFDTLRSAASSGPVIIINHSEWRSDILILLHDASPSLISTPEDFYDRAGALKDKLLNSRKKDGLDSNYYDDALASVLAELYKLVGKPVIHRLCQLQVPEQSRVWWCPTSVFCSLPLHAMGPIPSDDGELRYFSDLYISSYTPTLSALIQSRTRNSGSPSSDRPSILLVAQVEPSLPTVGGEIRVIQALHTEVTSLISAAATPARIIDGFHHHRFVHFACHGKLEAGKPFEAGFELHGDERLTLLEIVRSHVPTAELAFLSACHTAEVTEGSIIDEGLHLAAAVQYCGFRSVVGTMWAMIDEDGRELAKHFYKALFSNSRRDQGIPYPDGMPYHERSAEALHFAVKKLRRRRITLERWVNFVHYGA